MSKKTVNIYNISLSPIEVFDSNLYLNNLFSELTQIVTDVISDPTLPRTPAHPCKPFRPVKNALSITTQVRNVTIPMLFFSKLNPLVSKFVFLQYHKTFSFTIIFSFRIV